MCEATYYIEALVRSLPSLKVANGCPVPTQLSSKSPF